MGLKAPVTSGSDGPPREIPPAGNYLAVCNGVYMLGTQPGYNGGDPRMQVMLTFQLHKRKGPVKDSAGRVMEANAIMNFTANVKSTLMEYAGALRGKAFTEDELAEVEKAGGYDAEPLTGMGCRLTIAHEKNSEGKTKDKIKSVSPLDADDGDDCPAIDGDETYWDWTLGIEAPKRIEYFWKRAVENPKRSRDPVGAANGNPMAGSKPLIPATDDDIAF